MLRYRASLQGANVTITELPELLPVLEQNVNLNNLHEKCAVRSLPVQTACVDREEREREAERVGGEGAGDARTRLEHVGSRVTQSLAKGAGAQMGKESGGVGFGGESGGLGAGKNLALLLLWGAAPEHAREPGVDQYDVLTVGAIRCAYTSYAHAHTHTRTCSCLSSRV